ncbi:MAG: hypothetical protein WD276_10155 [Actinomycetota bacterium]
MRRRFVIALCSAAVLFVGIPAPAGAAPVPGTQCRVFPSNHIWNTPVNKLPVHAKSKVWLRSSHAGTTRLHPDFGGPPYGLPFQVVDGPEPKVAVDFYYDDESDPGPYPFGPDTPLEGGSDRHALMVDSDECVLYEIFDADWNGGDPQGGSGAVFDLSSNALRPDTWTSADAAGLAIFPGLVRYDEVQAGAINHAIRFTVDCTRNRHIWPARHDAGVNDPSCPPMGARFRMKAGFDISRFSASARVILRAMKRYGMFVTDNGSDWYFQGTMDPRWSDTLLDQLKSVPASAFVAVDESACKVSQNSAQANCP